MFKFISTSIIALSLGTAAFADTATMTRAIQGGSLHDGPLDMVAYWQPLDDGGFEVTATWRDRATDDAPMRTIMRLEDGDRTAFAMPGYTEALYSFSRTGEAVTVSVTVAAESAEIALHQVPSNE